MAQLRELLFWGSRNKMSHTTHGLNIRNVFSHSSEGQKSKILVLAGFTPSQVSLFGLYIMVFPTFSYSRDPPSVSVLSGSWYPLLMEDTCHIGLGPTPVALFWLGQLWKAPVPNAFWGTGIKVLIYELWTQPIIHPPTICSEWSWLISWAGKGKHYLGLLKNIVILIIHGLVCLCVAMCRRV